jgi:hypothetical protein
MKMRERPRANHSGIAAADVTLSGVRQAQGKFGKLRTKVLGMQTPPTDKPCLLNN